MNLRPRRDRWLTIAEVLKRIAKGNPSFYQRICNKTRRYQLLAVRRLIRQVEKRDNEVISKRFNGFWYVSFERTEMLMAPGDENLSTIEKNLADLAQQHRFLVKKVNDNCSRTRDHAEQIAKLSEKQRETTRYLAKIASLETDG